MHIKYLLLITILFSGAASADETSSKNTDNRKTLLLNNNERNFVLAEMRAFLTSVQKITQGLAENDMALVIKHAIASGKAAQTGMPSTLGTKLPAEFKKLGGDTHAKFDQLAMDADDLGDKDHTLKQLSTLLQNCVSCHAIYRIEL